MVTGVFFVGGNGVIKVGAEAISIVVDLLGVLCFVHIQKDGGVKKSRVRWHEVREPSATFPPKFDWEDMNKCSP